MSLSKQYIDEEMQICMQQLKIVDSEAYEEIRKDDKKRDELFKLMSEMMTAEDQLNSTFDTTKEGKSAFEKSVKTIAEALRFETFQVQIKGGKTTDALATFTRAGKPFLRDIKLLTPDDTELVTSKQASSIVIEIIVVMLSIAGIKYHLSHEQIERAAEKLEPYMGRIKDALRNLAYAWKHGSSLSGKAMAIIAFVKQVYHAGILMKSIKIVISYMSWWERAKALARIIIFIRTVCRNPRSILARLEAVLQKSAGIFTRKIDILVEISEIQESLDGNYIL